MKSRWICAFFMAVVPFALIAQTPGDWVGRFNINRNGSTGMLTIADSGRVCAGVVWCNLDILYRDADGSMHRGKILRMQPGNLRMQFALGFPGGSEIFDAYLFSRDRSGMAGTYRDSQGTFGFFATRTVGIGAAAAAAGTSVGAASAGPAPAAGGKRHAVINAHGQVEIHEPDGRIVIPQRCGSIVIFPDGRRSQSTCIETQPPLPPPPPQDTRWVDGENQRLLNIMQALVGDPSMVQNYVQTEGSGQNVYAILGSRIDTINKLLVQ